MDLKEADSNSSALNIPGVNSVKCSKCNDFGSYQIDHNTWKICECSRAIKTEKILKSSRITPAFRNKGFGNFDISRVHPKAKNAVEDMYLCAKYYSDNYGKINNEENNWLVLMGVPGSGKTHLGMAVVNEKLKQGINVLYFPHVEGMSEIMNAIGNSKDDVSIGDKLDGMKKVELLIWDDLFKPYGDCSVPSKFEIRIAYEVLNYRYLNLLPTIITTERFPEQLLGIDMATARRIIERSEGHQVYAELPETNFSLYGGVK